MSPGDKSLRDEFEAIKAARAKEVDYEKEMAKRLFSGGLYEEKVAPPKEVKKAGGSSHSGLPEFKEENPQVYFDITLGEGEKGRVVFELFPEQVPKTAENFRALCTGEKGGKLHYKNSIFHRVISGFMMQGGDTTNRNGTGGLSIYGNKFNDEGVWLPHTRGGLLSMANSGPNTNGSQFFVTFKETKWLDGKHMVFGRVIKGFEFCQTVENTKTGESDVPVDQVTIVDCGELSAEDKVKAEDVEEIN